VLVPPARRIASFGAGAVLDRADADGVAEACQKLLADPSYRERAQVIAGEIAGMPLPAEVVAVVEDLARAAA
jgi:glycosyltransferase